MKNTSIVVLTCSLFLLFFTTAKAQNYRSVSLDGINDYVSIGSIDTFNIANNLSIEVWVKIATVQNFPSWNRIVDKWNFDESAGYNLVLNNTKLRFEFCDELGVKHPVQSITDVKDNQWHYVVATFDTTHMKIYVDGELDNETEITESSIKPTSNQLAFGNNNDGNGWLPLTGNIDEVRIWNRVLLPEEISDFMKGYVALDQPGLLGYWNLNVSVDSIVPDLSDLANHGILRNGAELVPEVPYTVAECIIVDTTYVTVEDTIYVTVEDTTYVTVEDTMNIYLSGSGVDDEPFIKEIKVYPNPVEEVLFIEVDDVDNIENYSIKFYSTNGQLLYETPFNETLIEIDIFSIFGDGHTLMVIEDETGKVIDTRMLIIYFPA